MRTLTLLSILMLVATARADTTPWSQGVSAEQQKRANELVAEANELFAGQAHVQALEKYTAALALWDHPTIRFNMAVTLIRLDRFIEAGEALEAALRYGAEPFTPEKYQQALDYQKLINRQLGSIEASCDQAGAQVLLDGKAWFSCPGKSKRKVLAGEHAIVAEATTFITLSRRVVVSGGAAVGTRLSLVSMEAAVRYEYPTARWIPWTVGAAGAVLGLAGIPVWYAGRRQMDRFEAQYAVDCFMRCESDLSQHRALRDEYDSAMFKGRASVTMMISGGVIAVGGVVWGVFVNRPKRVLPEIEVAPTSGGAAVLAGWQL